MEFTLRPSVDGQYLETTVVGDVTRAGAVDVTKAQFELGQSLGIFCFLIDLTQARSIQPVLEHVRYTLDNVPELEPPGLPSCAALVVNPGDHSHDFHVAFARSQGIDIALFWARDLAIQHLADAAPRINAQPEA